VTSGDLLAAAVAVLYSADPGEFTQRRGELAAQARSAGQAPVARRIAKLPKPTQSAWVVNQLVRSDPGAASRLNTLGEELRAAERSRDGTRMRELSQARRQLIAALVRQALMVSGQQAPTAALREELTTTFAAALADPDVAEQIQAGTLLRAARRAGFGTAEVPGLTLVPPPSDRHRASVKDQKSARAEPTAKPPAAKPPAAKRPAASHAAAAARAKAELDRGRARAEAEQALAEADRAAEAAGEAEREQESTVRRLEEQLADTRTSLHEARTKARRAETAQRYARQALDRLRQ
jgi:hypothetical protein